MKLFAVTNEKKTILRIVETSRQAEMLKRALEKHSFEVLVVQLDISKTLNYLELALLCDEDTDARDEVLS